MKLESFIQIEIDDLEYRRLQIETKLLERKQLLAMISKLSPADEKVYNELKAKLTDLTAELDSLCGSKVTKITDVETDKPIVPYQEAPTPRDILHDDEMLLRNLQRSVTGTGETCQYLYRGAQMRTVTVTESDNKKTCLLPASNLKRAEQVYRDGMYIDVHLPIDPNQKVHICDDPLYQQAEMGGGNILSTSKKMHVGSRFADADEPVFCIDGRVRPGIDIYRLITDGTLQYYSRGYFPGGEYQHSFAQGVPLSQVVCYMTRGEVPSESGGGSFRTKHCQDFLSHYQLTITKSRAKTRQLYLNKQYLVQFAGMSIDEIMASPELKKEFDYIAEAIRQYIHPLKTIDAENILKKAIRETCTTQQRSRVNQYSRSLTS